MPPLQTPSGEAIPLVNIEWAENVFCCHRATPSETARDPFLAQGPVRYRFWRTELDIFLEAAYRAEFSCVVVREPSVRDSLLSYCPYIISVSIMTPTIDQDERRWFTSGDLLDRRNGTTIRILYEIFFTPGPDPQIYRVEESLIEKWICEVIGTEISINYCSNDLMFANVPEYRRCVMVENYFLSAASWVPALFYRVLQEGASTR